MKQHSEEVVKSAEVIGRDVISQQGEDLGKIEEIVLDKYSGEARYVVLSFGGILGLGDKLFALPWKSISYDPSKDCFILNIAKESLKQANGFDKDHWPNMSEPAWQESLNRLYVL